LNLEVSADVKPPQRIYEAHSGAVRGVAASPGDCYLASIGKDGKLLVYNVHRKKLLIWRRFPVEGTALLWVPLKVYFPEYLLLPKFIFNIK
jgi:hypothetical protein